MFTKANLLEIVQGNENEALMKLASLVDRDHLTEWFLFIIYPCANASAELLENVMRLAFQVIPDSIPSELILDALWICETTIESWISLSPPVLESVQCRLAELCYDADRLHRIPLTLLKERLDPETLERAGLIPSRQNMQKRMIRINTHQLYRQCKFNLYREATEGYAKCVCLLLDLFSSLSNTNNSVKKVAQHLHDVVGQFDLDPNRVTSLLVDVALECILPGELTLLHCSQSLRQRSLQQVYLLMDCLAAFGANHTVIAQTIGFQYASNQKRSYSHALDLIVAVLIQKQWIQLEQLLPHLSPDETASRQAYRLYAQRYRQRARDYGQVSLASDENETMKSESTNTTDPTAMPHQVARIVEALLRIGAWTPARQLLRQFPYLVVMFASVAEALSHVLCYASCGEKGSLFSTGDIPLCQTLTQIQEQVLPWLLLGGSVLGTGVHVLSVNLILFQKFCQLVCKEEWAHWRSPLLGKLILPATCLLSSQCTTVAMNCVWPILNAIAPSERYQLYAQWLQSYDRLLPLSLARAQVLHETKKVLRRLSRENVRHYARVLSPWLHAHPLLVLSTLMEQIQAYENLIQPVVEVLRYASHLDWDCIGFMLVRRMQETGHSASVRWKSDSEFAAQWWQSICQWISLLCRRYSSMPLQPLLLQLIKELQAGDASALLLLQRLLEWMGALPVHQQGEMSESSIEAHYGGTVLEQLDTLALFMKTCGDDTNTSSNSNTTSSSSNATTGSSLIATLQSTQTIQKQTKRANVRLMEALQPLIHPLTALLSTTQKSCLFAGHGNEHLKYLSSLLDQSRETWTQFMKFLKNNNGHVGSHAITAPEPFVHEQFYTTFWELSLSDIQVPEQRYQSEISRQKQLLAEVDKCLTRVGSASSSVLVLKKEKERLTALIIQLNNELKQRQERVQSVHERLTREHSQWLQTQRSHGTVNPHLLQYCLMPRLRQSTQDAIYCANFLWFMHRLGAPHFSSLSLMNLLLTDIRVWVFSCSEQEALFYGRFLEQLLLPLHQWHHDKNLYAREALGMDEKSESTFRPGFSKRWTKDGDSTPTAQDLLTHQEFRRVLLKWHLKLLTAFLSCLSSQEYMQTKNAMLILTRLLTCFPAIASMAQQISDQLQKIKEAEKREDLKILAMRYQALLRAKMASMVANEALFVEEDQKKMEVTRENEIKEVKKEMKDMKEVTEKNEVKEKEKEKDEITNEKVKTANENVESKQTEQETSTLDISTSFQNPIKNLIVSSLAVDASASPQELEKTLRAAVEASQQRTRTTVSLAAGVAMESTQKRRTRSPERVSASATAVTPSVPSVEKKRRVADDWVSDRNAVNDDRNAVNNDRNSVTNNRNNSVNNDRNTVNHDHINSVNNDRNSVTNNRNISVNNDRNIGNNDRYSSQSGRTLERNTSTLNKSNLDSRPDSRPRNDFRPDTNKSDRDSNNTTRRDPEFRTDATLRRDERRDDRPAPYRRDDAPRRRNQRHYGDNK